MPHHQHDRAHVRAQAARHAARRASQIRAQRPGYSSHWLDLDGLRDDLDGAAGRRFHRRVGLHTLEDADLARLREVLASSRRLRAPRVLIDRQLVRELGAGIMRALEPWSFRLAVGLDQRLSYHRMEVEPEWSRPDITARRRTTRRRAWMREIDTQWHEDDMIAPAQAHSGRSHNYDRWAGGLVKA
jgi:hypothetical protein